MRPLVLFFAATLAIPAASAAGPSRPYTLAPGSDFEVGCFAPCLCPVLLRSPTEGVFSLSPIDTDAGELRFDVSDIDWIAWRYDGVPVHVTGSGLYRLVDGDTQLHQMKLALRVDDQPEQIFDSGLVPGGDKFPVIDIAVATSDFTCWDSVFTIQATAALVDAETRGPALGIFAATPNPFRGRIVLWVTVPDERPVDVIVYDGSGRVVRTLAANRAFDAGVHPLAWDGRRDDGTIAPAGVYWARTTSRGASHTRALFKVH